MENNIYHVYKFQSLGVYSTIKSLTLIIINKILNIVDYIIS